MKRFYFLFSRRSYVTNPVLCVTLNGQCFQIFAPQANIDGSFLDVISCEALQEALGLRVAI